MARGRDTGRVPSPWSLVPLNPVERTGNAMTDTTVMTIDMAVLVGIFVLGFLAKLFPRRAGKRDQELRD